MGKIDSSMTKVPYTRPVIKLCSLYFSVAWTRTKHILSQTRQL